MPTQGCDAIDPKNKLYIHPYLEVDSAPLPVREPAVVQNLEEDIEHGLVGLLHLGR